VNNSNICRALAALRDVAGVHGSFVLRLDGALVDKDLPSVFHDDLFIEVGARLSRFIETMSADTDDVSSAILRFADHRLYLTRFPHGMLAVITANDINAAALRMALTLTTRRIALEMTAMATTPPPPASPLPALAPAAGVMAGSPGAPRTYRGRVISG
jgi:predicted regulator of Ras-like GTPase activity (Roadblock/LC7/MglB family)